MSTLAYAIMTAKHERSAPGLSMDSQPLGVGTYLVAIAALVPAEVLALHAVILTNTTKSTTDANGQAVVTITASNALAVVFWGLIILSVLIYIGGLKRMPRGLDLVRMLIPTNRVCSWTMLQPSTAYDAVFGNGEPALRTPLALLIVAGLSLVATRLGELADQKQP